MNYWNQHRVHQEQDLERISVQQVIQDFVTNIYFIILFLSYALYQVTVTI